MTEDVSALYASKVSTADLRRALLAAGKGGMVMLGFTSRMLMAVDEPRARLLFAEGLAHKGWTLADVEAYNLPR